LLKGVSPYIIIRLFDPHLMGLHGATKIKIPKHKPEVHER
jgi:hypothetical protein